MNRLLDNKQSCWLVFCVSLHLLVYKPRQRDKEVNCTATCDLSLVITCCYKVLYLLIN